MRDDEIYEYLGEVFEWDRMKAALNVLHRKQIGKMTTKCVTSTIFRMAPSMFGVNGLSS